MQHLTEQIIERFIRDSSLDPDQSQKINAHLSECNECREIYNWLKSFYGELDDIDPGGGGSYPYNESGPINLNPLDSESFFFDQQDTPMGLTAHSDESTSRFQHIIALCSNEHQIVVRILYDNQRDQYLLFLITPEQVNTGFWIVALPNHKKEIVTNEQGEAAFTMDSHPDIQQWEHTQGILRTPLTRFELKTDCLERLKKNQGLEKYSDGFTIHFSLDEGDSQHESSQKLNVNVREALNPKRKLSKILCQPLRKKNQLLQLNNGTARFNWNTLKHEPQMKFAVYE